ncbi:hypothetical protein RTE01_31680 [Raoultella terrigena]|uniref:Uncharacterized protein n=1 Tax=Raoultella terrigena TaxID=577 RepID=A0A485B092_RAOTE|nr:hypothetical protein [Raoultella terrigena]GEC68533.1 hypothetical protein RTE01_31680 [Raoultella terrigena]VFS66715.1 Uncharacterised protein [Raoultella terrigena]
MKSALQKVKDGIAAMLLGKNPEQLADEQRQAAVKNAVDDYLARHPDWKLSTKPAPKAAPVTNSKQKTARIKMALGAGAGKFIPHVVDEVALERARIKSREVVASDPERYSHIIDSTSLNRIG